MMTHQKYCIVQLGEYSLGFDVQFVRSAHETTSCTPLPIPVPYVLGVINLRGQVLSLFDTLALCDLEQQEAKKRITFLFLECSRGKGGLLIDKIDDVIEVEQAELHPPQSNFNPSLRAFVSSILEYQDRLVLILDFEKIYDVICRGKI